MLNINSSVGELHGIGPSRAAAFAKKGIHTLRDLIYFLPRAYEYRGNVRPLSSGIDGQISSYMLTVGTQPRNAMIRRGMTLTKFRAFDESGTAEIVFFNQPYVKDVFTVGSTFRFWGKVTAQRTGPQMASPKYEPVIDASTLPDYVPVYSLSDGLTPKVIDGAVQAALRAVLPTLDDPLPERIRQKYRLPTLACALRDAHSPINTESLAAALRRIAFDELFYFAVAMSLSKKRAASSGRMLCRRCDLTPVTSTLPYRLTAAQARVVDEIVGDMTRVADGGGCLPMNRILVGDVGSGKTICASLSAYTAVTSGYQVAIVAPTEILARQHYADIAKLLTSHGIRTELLIGATPTREKSRIYADAESGSCDILIGTHALFNEKLRFHSLGLIVTDEQHRFGVMQRANLKNKNPDAHLLVMSATPIPRTLALVMYGDLDVSRIDEMPVGRQRVDTFVVGESYRARLNAFIKKQTEAGGRVYIVCPSIEEKEDEDDGSTPIEELEFVIDKAPPLKAARQYAEELRRTLPDIPIGFLHGKMKSQEKDAAMSDFTSGKTKVLVSTTVIEVGVNVPEATLMIVENAERFGLSQLHQLRGRVGRGKQKSYCVLVSDADGELSRARLDIMRKTYDGYRIAECDLELRGPGDFLASAADDGMRQSGGMALRFANTLGDSALMNGAFTEARALIADDPTLSSPLNLPIKAEAERIFRASDSIMN